MALKTKNLDEKVLILHSTFLLRIILKVVYTALFSKLFEKDTIQFCGH